jgi:amino acid adenylation domain-containing protein
VKLRDFGLLEDDAARAEARELLRRFNDTATAYPRDRTVHALFGERARQAPDAVAAQEGASRITYGELDEASNRVARVLVEAGLAREGFVAVLIEDTVALVTALLGILKAGGAYCPLEPDTPYERIRLLLDDTGARVLITTRARMREANRLQWDCAALETLLVLDSDDARAEPEALGEKMKREVWDYVGQTMVDDISGGGWQSSFTGQWLSREVMDDYGENVRRKLGPHLRPEHRVLEIGCASGISLFRLAPLVAEYVGTDLSPAILAWTRRQSQARGLDHVRLLPLAAHEIERANARDVDVVVMNSVLQCFSGHNYLRAVLRAVIGLMKDGGLIFLGNVFDRDLEDRFLADLRAFQQAHRGSGYRTKTDYGEELFIDRAFLDDLRHDLPEIAEVQCSPLLGTHESELSRYSFDAILRIDKTRATAAPRPPRRKRQLDRRALAAAGAEPLAERAGPEALAYVMYTSGTSGRPKGVLVEHRAIARLVLGTSFVSLDASTRILMTGAVAFDASTFEIWGALLNGGTLVRPPGKAVLDAAEMKRLIRGHGITTMWLTASLFNQFAETDVDLFAGLRELLIGGERLSTRHVNLVRRAHPGLTLVNGYGPTENTTFTTCHRIERTYEHDVPLGRPIANTQVLILDAGGQPVPVGIPGEICAAGDGLARGYLNDPALTAERFVAHPWEPGRRIYRTGDRGRWTADGVVHFLGRMDEQVKIRGFRVEPAEIEHRVRAHDGVADAVVVTLEHEGERELAAYVTGAVDAAALRVDLESALPAYMVPAHLVVLDRFPLNASGKIDRRALPRPDRRGTGASGASALEGETERALAGIWEEVLGAHGVGATDDFFDLGGHSLKITKLVALVQQRLGVQVPLAAVFRRPTVRALARYLVETAQHGVPLADETMVVLGGGPDAPAIFALPPGTGDVLSYVPLAARWPGHRLCAFNFVEDDDRLSRYADLVVASDPRGSHLLFGYSSGGNLAFHLAGELERRGHRVSAIVMVDSGRTVSPYPYLPDVVMQAARDFLAHEAIQPYCATPVLRDKVIRKIVACYGWLARTIDDHVVDADIHVLLQADAPPEVRHDGRLVSSVAAWATATRGTFRTYAGAGSHTQMLAGSALETNAATLREIVEAATARGVPG